jgi:hypothetical protein
MNDNHRQWLTKHPDLVMLMLTVFALGLVGIGYSIAELYH